MNLNYLSRLRSYCCIMCVIFSRIAHPFIYLFLISIAHPFLYTYLLMKCFFPINKEGTIKNKGKVLS